MAGTGDVQGRRSSQRRTHSTPVRQNDWTGTDELPPSFSPHLRPPRPRVYTETIDVVPTTPSQRRLTSSTRASTTVRSTPSIRPSTSSMRTLSAPVPMLSRAATVHHHPWQQYPYQAHPYIYEEEDRSRSDSRRSQSRRGISPLSGNFYQSMAGSRPSSRTSVSDSDEETHEIPRPPKVPPPPQSRRAETQYAETQYGDDDRSTRRSRSRPPPPRRGEVIYEEDSELLRNSLENPFLQRPRSQSRPASDRRERHRSSRPEEDHRRKPSVDHTRSRSRSKSQRPSRKHYESEVVYRERPSSSARRSKTTPGGSNVTSYQSVGSSARRSSSSFFGFAPSRAPEKRKDVKLVHCVVCLDDDIPSHKAPRLVCGHRMCTTCLKKNFELSISNPQHMPPKCCTVDPIPVEHVAHLFDKNFQKNWNRKFAEYSTRNRVYCPGKRCGAWIKPANIQREPDGRKKATCSRCHTKVCCLCNREWHRERKCSLDEETKRFLEQAKEEGWQRCYRCKTMVELKEGCNHMTCVCGADFCMICGLRWKTCECPWFNQDAVDVDYLEDLGIPPINIRPEPINVRPDRFDSGPSSPRDFRLSNLTAPAAAVRPRPQNYEEEMLLRRLQEQRDQEQRDEELARHLQASAGFDDDHLDYHGGFGDIHCGRSGGDVHGMRRGDIPSTRNGDIHGMRNGDIHSMRAGHVHGMRSGDTHGMRNGDVHGIRSDDVHGVWGGEVHGMRGRHMGHFASDDYLRRGVPNVMVPPLSHPPPAPPAPAPAPHVSPPTQHGPFERVNPGTGYVPGVNKARGVRSSSMERRLAERFNPDLRNSPIRGKAGPPPPPPTHPILASAATMPIAPLSASGLPVLRRHTMEAELYNGARNTRPGLPVRMQQHEYEVVEAAAHAPLAPTISRRDREQPPRGHRQHHPDPPKRSMLAGLTGPGRGMDRVYEWAAHVEPGTPDGETT